MIAQAREIHYMSNYYDSSWVLDYVAYLRERGRTNGQIVFYLTQKLKRLRLWQPGIKIRVTDTAVEMERTGNV